MAYKGTAAKSASGASMSKYDVEVEARLKALEAKAHEKCSGGSAPAAGLEAKVLNLKQNTKTWLMLSSKILNWDWKDIFDQSRKDSKTALVGMVF